METFVSSRRFSSGDHNETAEFDVAEAIRIHTEDFSKKLEPKGVTVSIEVPPNQVGVLKQGDSCHGANEPYAERK